MKDQEQQVIRQNNARLKADDIVSGTIGAEAKINVRAPFLQIDGKAGRIYGTNGEHGVFLLGRRDDGTWGFDLAPDGVEVIGASIDDLLLTNRAPHKRCLTDEEYDIFILMTGFGCCNWDSPDIELHLWDSSYTWWDSTISSWDVV